MNTPGQETLELGRLYSANATSEIGDGADKSVVWQLRHSIWINSGAVDVYSSNSDTEPSTLSDMTLNTEDTAVEGLSELNIVPNYITIVQNMGETTEIVAIGISVTNIKAIA